MPQVRLQPGWLYRRGSPLATPARTGLLCLLACFAACGSPPPPPPPAIPYTDPGFVATGDVRLHYALTPTQDLPAGIAGSYGIVQRRNLALLTITIVPQGAPAATRLVASELSATAIALTGERKALALARHDDPGGPTYLATVDVRHRVPVTIEIQARVSPDSPRITTRWTRQFHLE